MKFDEKIFNHFEEITRDESIPKIDEHYIVFNDVKFSLEAMAKFLYDHYFDD